MKKFLLTLLFAALLSPVLYAQKTLASPRDTVQAKIDDAVVTVNYGSPSVKGRKIWGRLVPYNQVWRTGANEATTFSVSKDILVEGKPLAAGTYGLFTIPGENDWTVIFNKVAKQWGAFEYSEKEDALRVQVKPMVADTVTEHLHFNIVHDSLFLQWEKLNVPLKLSRADIKR